MQNFRRQVVLFVGLMGCLAFSQGWMLRSNAEDAIPAGGDVQAVRTDDGRTLGTVEWTRGRALAQGVAFISPGMSDDSPTYWRAARRARSQAVARLADLVVRAARDRHLDTSSNRVERSVERALVVDSDYDSTSGQVTLTLSASLYGPLGAIGPTRDASPAFYDLYRHPAPSYSPPPPSQPDAEPVPPDAEPVPPPAITPVPTAPIDTRPTDSTVFIRSAEDANAGLPGTPVGQEGPFTGVVIDCRGLQLSPSMSPKILTPDGNEVWGTVHVSHDFAVVTGIAGFMDDWNRARSYEPRVGTHPLILRAIDRAGGRYKNDAVISDADAAWLKRENDRSHFLDQFHVMFVDDPLPGE